MNPTIEVQITAKLDRLDAALKVAEAKISQSAVTMGKAGEKAGANVMQGFASNLPMMMVATAMAHTIGKGISQAVKDVNAGKSGEEIGLGMAQGIVDGAKSLPVVGVVFEILDELVNGATRYIEKLNEAVTKAVEKYISSMQSMTQATKDFKKATQEKAEDAADLGDPAAIARRVAERQNQKADADAQASKELGLQSLREKRKQQDLQDAATMASMKGEGVSGDVRRALAGEISRDEQIAQNKKKSDSEFKRAAEAVAKNDAEIDAALIARKLANQEELNKKLAELNKKSQDEKSAATAKSAADEKTAADKALAEKKKADDALIELAKKQDKAKVEAAIQAQQDIINGEKQAQEQIDKIGRVDQMAAQAAQGMIGSGQTALGQFNFAQSGAGNQAITLAQKQVTSLEKIEAATAEQVRLQKEMRGFN
jgi:hypothetical protein